MSEKIQWSRLRAAGAGNEYKLSVWIEGPKFFFTPTKPKEGQLLV